MDFAFSSVNPLTPKAVFPITVEKEPNTRLYFRMTFILNKSDPTSLPSVMAVEANLTFEYSPVKKSYFAAQSPIAKISGSDVRRYSFTNIPWLGSHLRPNISPSDIFGLQPTEMMTISAGITAPSSNSTPVTLWTPKIDLTFLPRITSPSLLSMIFFTLTPNPNI